MARFQVINKVVCSPFQHCRESKSPFAECCWQLCDFGANSVSCATRGVSIQHGACAYRSRCDCASCNDHNALSWPLGSGNQQ